MGQRLTRLSLMDQSRNTEGGSQTLWYPETLWGDPVRFAGSDPLLAR
jgi:hypothetical protein